MKHVEDKVAIGIARHKQSRVTRKITCNIPVIHPLSLTLVTPNIHTGTYCKSSRVLNFWDLFVDVADPGVRVVLVFVSVCSMC